VNPVTAGGRPVTGGTKVRRGTGRGEAQRWGRRTVRQCPVAGATVLLGEGGLRAGPGTPWQARP
jgi:hypothetical protein